MNTRVFVEKKLGFRVEAESLLKEINENLNMNIESLRLINVYDIFNINDNELINALNKVFSEFVTDNVFNNISLQDKKYIAVEYLPGQYDQRASSAMQCLKLINPKSEAVVKSGKLIIFEGNEIDLNKIKKYYINEIESREKDLRVLTMPNFSVEEEKYEIKDFNILSSSLLKDFLDKQSLSMSYRDLKFIQNYFINEEKRNPTITEIKMLDTYWSDHCRHTTFETELKNISFSKDYFIFKSFQDYMSMREKVKRKEKPITLMDMATINSKFEYENGNLSDLEISEENNACSIYIDVNNNDKIEKWLLMFKNETHNHPTEIEPFGGASTCIGGAIRDPLSGRSFVYQAMRVTGAGNINEPIDKTLPGKIPQRIISTHAASGYSSYGNQIGLSTTHVREIYHEGFVAKRLEVGAVVGAVKASYIRREKPALGDAIILLGGKTGRDGIGGATGSSKEHNEKSLEVCSSEVQKGNAIEERKIQKLFRNSEVISLIKKSNDFGAGGVSVAIGELADGIEIDLNKVPLKYFGLSGTEIAISESQERMAVVVDDKDADKFIKLANNENIEAVKIASVKDNNRLVMNYNGRSIVNLNRDFINTNGVRQETSVKIRKIDYSKNPFKRKVKGVCSNEVFLNNLLDPNVAIQKGLIEMFDSTIGSTTVLMPFGGKYQRTESQVSIQKIPLLQGNTETSSIMAFGYNPFIFTWSPYHGAQYSVVESMAKIVAAGGDYKKIRFTFQEYFEKLNFNAYKWGNAVSAMLGSIDILKQFSLASIGGKDSMSGTFKNISVPPTLISFGVTVIDAKNVISPEFKESGNYIYYIKHTPLNNLLPNSEQLKENFEFINKEIINKNIISAFTIQYGGIAEALAKMSYGNGFGVSVETNFDLYSYDYGSFIVESKTPLDYKNAYHIGYITLNDLKINDICISVDEAYRKSISLYEGVYPTTSKSIEIDMSICKEYYGKPVIYGERLKKVKVIIPVFPGTNCDYDTQKAFNECGAETIVFTFKNRTDTDINYSINELARLINEANILVLSGGFSLGDEPDGSGKFISNVLNNNIIKKAINNLLKRKCLILGICNGFQALLKSGIFDGWKVDENSPTLFRNDINRHISHIAKTRVVSNLSPWLSGFKVGETFDIPMSHGEGKFVIDEELAKQFFDKGQVAFQYVDDFGNATMDSNYNLNGSFYAIEAITSSDGLILGKMGHSERKGNNLYKNISGNKNQDIFSNAVKYFRGE